MQIAAEIMHRLQHEFRWHPPTGMRWTQTEEMLRDYLNRNLEEATNQAACELAHENFLLKRKLRMLKEKLLDEMQREYNEGKDINRGGLYAAMQIVEKEMVT